MGPFGTGLWGLLRVVHVLSAIVLLVAVYTPWIEGDGGVMTARIALVPLLTISGVWLWIGRVRAPRREAPGAIDTGV